LLCLALCISPFFVFCQIDLRCDGGSRGADDSISSWFRPLLFLLSFFLPFFFLFTCLHPLPVCLLQT
jgi:hypothetical protein